MQDPLALAEHRLAAGELRPALDALKEARAQAFESGDRDRLERVRALALELRPLLGAGSKADWSCGVLLFAVDENLEQLTAGQEQEAKPAPIAAIDPPPRPTRKRRPTKEPEPPPHPEPPPPPEPEPEPEPEREPVIGRSVVQTHVVEAETSVLEPEERLLGMFHGVVRETREDGSRGRPKGGVVLHDYLLVTDRRIVLWARGRSGSIEAYPLAEITGAEPVRARLGCNVAIDVDGTRRWFASMRRGEDEQAAELIRELAGLR